MVELLSVGSEVAQAIMGKDPEDNRTLVLFCHCLGLLSMNIVKRVFLKCRGKERDLLLMCYALFLLGKDTPLLMMNGSYI